jgi:NAD(P)-dependent dehydrogenase (short-subunit alcohol dehydrogenase family)
VASVLITGANRGLGLGLARAYHDDGWDVIAVSRRRSVELEQLGVESFVQELADDSALERLAATLNGRTVDVLINNAGRMAIPDGAPQRSGLQGFGHFDRALWREVFDINVFTPMKLCELLADAVGDAPRGRMVVISSALGSMALNEQGGLYAYRSSKAAVNAIVKSMAADLGARGIIAVALSPGWVRTDMGGPDADLSVAESAAAMKAVIDGLKPEDSGKFLAHDGRELPW